MAAGLPIYVFLLTHSVSVTGAMLLAKLLPKILVSPFAGVLVDRLHRIRVLIVVNLLLAGTVMLLFLVRSESTLWILYVESVLVSGLDSFVGPAASGVMPTLVSRENLPRAITMASVSMNLAGLLGPALGGWVAARHGLVGLAAVDGCSFLGAAALTAFVRAPGLPRRHTGESILESLADGVRVLFRSPTLRIVLIGLCVVALGDGAFGLLYPVFVARILHGGAELSGILLSASAAGGLIAGVVLVVLGRKVVSRRFIGAACFAIAAGVLARLYAPRLTTSATVELVLFALAAFVAMFATTGFMSLLLAHAPPSHRGRIDGSLGVVAMLSALVGTGLATLVVDRIGIVNTMTLDAVTYVVGGTLALTFLPSDEEPKSA